MLLCTAVCIGALGPHLFILAPLFLRANGQDERHIGMVMGSFPLAALVAMPIWARIAERKGARFSLATGVGLNMLGCLLFELAGATQGWMGARALMGFGWSGVLVGGSLATTLLAPPGRLAQAIGISGVLTLLTAALGPSVGELIVRHFGWLWVFRTALVSAALSVLLTLPLSDLRAPDRPQPQGSDPSAKAPTTPLRWAEIRPLTAMLLVATGFGSVVAFLADHCHLVGDFEVSPFYNSYVAAAIAVRLTLGSLPDRVGPHSVLIPTFIGQAISLAVLALLSARWQLYLAGVIFGVTHGLYYPTMTALVVQRADTLRRARALASVHFMFSLGMVLAAFAGGTLAERFGYSWAFATATALISAGATLIAVDRSLTRGMVSRA